jgi:hypothetical protein
MTVKSPCDQITNLTSQVTVSAGKMKFHHGLSRSCDMDNAPVWVRMSVRMFGKGNLVHFSHHAVSWGTWLILASVIFLKRLCFYFNPLKTEGMLRKSGKTHP